MPERLQELSSLSSISSHPLAECSPDSHSAAAAASAAHDMPFMALERERTLRHPASDSGQAQGRLPLVREHLHSSQNGSLKQSKHSSSGHSVSSSQAITSNAQSTLVAAGLPASAQPHQAQPHKRATDTWLAGNLAQLAELEHEFEQRSPAVSPRRRAPQDHAADVGPVQATDNASSMPSFTRAASFPEVQTAVNTVAGASSNVQRRGNDLAGSGPLLCPQDKARTEPPQVCCSPCR